MRGFGKVLSLVLFGLFMIEVILFSPKDTATPEQIKSENTAEKQASGDGQWIEGIHLIETSEGKKEWELWAERASGSKERGYWLLHKMRAKFFSKTDQSFFYVTGQEGHVWINTKDMEVRGNVVVTSANGYVVKTDAVNYKSVEKVLRSSYPVNMVGPLDKNGTRLRLDGVGMFASVDGGFIDIQDQVKVRKTLDDGRKVVITSQKARFSSKSKVASFKDDVVVDLAASRITGPEAHFEYDSVTDALTSMKVEGGVRITDIDKWATARKVHMSFTRDKIVLNGSPRVVQNNDELRGEEIVFLDGGKTVHVQRAKARFDSNSKEFNR